MRSIVVNRRLLQGSLIAPSSNLIRHDSLERFVTPSSSSTAQCRSQCSGPLSGNMMDLPVSFEDISTASFRIRNGIIRTPCARSNALSDMTGMNVWFKHEINQVTGSFKERGARNALKLLSPEQRERGVIAASAGNHALAMAWHGRDLGIHVTCVMPTIAPLTKVENCRAYGGNAVIYGGHIGEAKDYAMSHPDFEGMTYINGYDHPHIIAGAGTMGVEILEEVPDIDAVVVPTGGGGLIAGVGLAMKTLKPEVQVIGVEPANCASFAAALEAGQPVDAKVLQTLADGLAVPRVGDNAFEVARHTVDRVVSVSEREIAIAVLRLVERERRVVEGGGAAGLAAILPGGPLDIPELKGKNVVIPLCGGNIDTTVLGRVIDRGLAADNRLVQFECTVSDRTGGLAELCNVIADSGASVKDLHHERAWVYSSLMHVQVKVFAETTGLEHAQRLRQRLIDESLLSVWGKEKISDEIFNPVLR